MGRCSRENIAVELIESIGLLIGVAHRRTAGAAAKEGEVPLR